MVLVLWLELRDVVRKAWRDWHDGRATAVRPGLRRVRDSRRGLG